MVDHIFTTQLPALTNLQDSIYTLGTLFFSDIDGLILGTRVYVGAVPTTTPLGQLYRMDSDTTGELLASKAFGTLVAGEWNDILFDVPVEIVAGQGYITAWGPTNNYSATGGFFDSTDVVNGHLTAFKTLTDRQNGKFKVSPTDAYPSETFNGGNYFVDTIFQLPGEDPVSYLKNSFFFPM